MDISKIKIGDRILIKTFDKLNREYPERFRGEVLVGDQIFTAAMEAKMPLDRILMVDEVISDKVVRCNETRSWGLGILSFNIGMIDGVVTDVPATRPYIVRDGKVCWAYSSIDARWLRSGLTGYFSDNGHNWTRGISTLSVTGNGGLYCYGEKWNFFATDTLSSPLPVIADEKGDKWTVYDPDNADSVEIGAVGIFCNDLASVPIKLNSNDIGIVLGKRDSSDSSEFRYQTFKNFYRYFIAKSPKDQKVRISATINGEPVSLTQITTQMYAAQQQVVANAER